MVQDPGWRPRRRPRSRAARRTAICCAVLLALGGCTTARQQQPSPSTQASGSTAATPAATGDGTGLIPPDTASGSTAPSAPGSGTSVPPSPPQAATLAWLSGADDHSGVQLDTDQGRRWQGPVAGEYALLGSSGYQWFGADGSLVGCAADAGCVAVDGSGTIAVTTKHKGPRLVFSAKGDFLARYSPAGDKMADPHSRPSLSKALAASGVDLAALVNAASMRAPFAGGATGDPHLITAGGVRFTTQQAGQFVARGGDPEHAIQLWFTPMAHRQDVSLVSQAAIGTGDAVITVDETGSLTIDGTVRPRRSAFDQVTLADGVAVGRWPATGDRSVTVAVVWPDGGSVVLTARPALGITVVAHFAPTAGVVGLFGAAGRHGSSDLLSRSGDPMSVDRTVASWAVSPSERMFPTEPTPIAGFPEQSSTVSPGAASVGQQACGSQGLHNTDDLAACAFDVGLTGDTGFVAGHVELATVAESPSMAASFAARWPALLPGSLSGVVSLPDDGHIGVTLARHQSRTYRVTIDQAGSVKFVNRSGCGVGETPPGIDQAAMRLFDKEGQPVSDRFALCGHEQSPTLQPGVYYLVVADGPSATRYVRVDVTVP